MTKLLFAAAAAILACSSAGATEYRSSLSRDEAKIAFIDVFQEAGYQLVNETMSLLEMARSADGITQSTFGTRFSPHPTSRVRATFLPDGSGTKVSVDSSVVSNAGSVFAREYGDDVSGIISIGSARLGAIPGGAGGAQVDGLMAQPDLSASLPK